MASSGGRAATGRRPSRRHRAVRWLRGRPPVPVGPRIRWPPGARLRSSSQPDRQSRDHQDRLVGHGGDALMGDARRGRGTPAPRHASARCRSRPRRSRRSPGPGRCGDGLERRGDRTIEERVDRSGLVAEDRAEPERQAVDEGGLAGIRSAQRVGEVAVRPRSSAIAAGRSRRCRAMRSSSSGSPGQAVARNQARPSAGQPRRGGEPVPALAAARAAEREDQRARQLDLVRLDAVTAWRSRRRRAWRPA